MEIEQGLRYLKPNKQSMDTPTPEQQEMSQAELRYLAFLSEILQTQKVWTLAQKGGYLIFKDAEGDEVFPVWPDQTSALAFIPQEQMKSGVGPVEISLEPFVRLCIPDMEEEGVMFGVHYEMESNGLVVSSEKLAADIELMKAAD